MFVKLLEVCQKYDLRIWADSGTLLGAVREGGYIPWDDDMDFVMFRKDYDKLIEVAPSEFTHPFFLQSGYTENFYCRGHAQLRYSESAEILYDDIWQDFNQGVFIDIFVYDKIPSDKKIFYETVNKARKIRNKLILFLYVKFLPIRPKGLLYQLLYHKYRDVDLFRNEFKRYDDLFRKLNLELGDNYSKLPHVNTDSYLKRCTVKVEWYNSTLYVPFENVKIPIPGGYDDILKKYYGDYMKPSKRPPLHGNTIIDTDKSYQIILKELRNSLPWYRRKILF